MLSLCNNLLKLALNGFLTQKEMMKKMVLPAEGHHTGKVGQSDQLTSHLYVQQIATTHLWDMLLRILKKVYAFKINLLGLALSRKEGS